MVNLFLLLETEPRMPRPFNLYLPPSSLPVTSQITSQVTSQSPPLNHFSIISRSPLNKRMVRLYHIHPPSRPQHPSGSHVCLSSKVSLLPLHCRVDSPSSQRKHCLSSQSHHSSLSTKIGLKPGTTSNMPVQAWNHKQQVAKRAPLLSLPFFALSSVHGVALRLAST
ncbi:hypothetical protein EJ06DRAFT_355207 [Trichodelitschia bisporula]|uniref:Uncharacterized protein n=1 Tax=Trichodelitschia bisporula TaxID=703511 RepID=A0A6G1I086_9PEZI|nr:hypothetical protein EJ06DRAFT_355207 [Trichodelitschia bisporula]